MPIEDLPISESIESPPPEEVYDEAESRVETDVGKRAQRILDELEQEYPPLYCFLDGETPFQLLVAVILSAQCTDEVVNETTPELFDRYPTPKDLAAAPREDVEDIIYSTGFYRSKAEYIQNTAERLLEEHDGELPTSVSELIELPGVARKTATAVLWYSFGVIEGITVDTHVLRLAERLGFTEADSPERVEKDLMELLPQDRWPWATYLLISHGREICTAQSPQCEDCSISPDCPSAFTFDD